MAEKSEMLNDRVQAAIETPVPHIYANGFATSMHTSDLLVAFELNGSPALTVNMSFTTAKTLVVKVGAAIAALESATGRPMLITDEVEKYMSEASK